jgi:hypothetical protein
MPIYLNYFLLSPAPSLFKCFVSALKCQLFCKMNRTQWAGERKNRKQNHKSPGNHPSRSHPALKWKAQFPNILLTLMTEHPDPFRKIINMNKPCLFSWLHQTKARNLRLKRNKNASLSIEIIINKHLWILVALKRSKLVIFNAGSLLEWLSLKLAKPVISGCENWRREDDE